MSVHKITPSFGECEDISHGRLYELRNAKIQRSPMGIIYAEKAYAIPLFTSYSSPCFLSLS